MSHKKKDKTGRKDELHQAENRQEETVDRPSRRRISARETLDQQGQRGDRDPEPEGVQDDRHEDERQSGLSSSARFRWHSGGRQGPRGYRGRFIKIEGRLG